jgi:hypothetical protein
VYAIGKHAGFFFCESTVKPVKWRHPNGTEAASVFLLTHMSPATTLYAVLDDIMRIYWPHSVQWRRKRVSMHSQI